MKKDFGKLLNGIEIRNKRLKKFLFVIPQSPSALISPFRKSLIDISLLSLKNQTNYNWEAVFLGEESKSEGNFHYLNLGGVSKEEKLHRFVDWLKKQTNKPEYIIRFDDDDLISPSILEKINGLDFDCYADRWHYFFDTTSGNCSRQLRKWLPNTVIHKTEHALATYGNYHKGVFSTVRKPSLLQNDHSSFWHLYYQVRKIIYAPKNEPVYLRVLSPSSITANLSVSFDKKDYAKYREGFGLWDAPLPNGFEKYVSQLLFVYEKEFGHFEKYNLPLLKKIKYKLKERLGS